MRGSAPRNVARTLAANSGDQLVADRQRILIACEVTGRVRDEFENSGYDAWSCDLLPTESEQTRASGKHFECDVREILEQGWDMLIGHPPCTMFANAGLHYLKTKPGRKEQLQQAFDLLLLIWNAPIKHIGIENPIGWLNTNWQRPTQIIQPYYFGEKELKTTCLWLKNLPRLEYRLNDNLFGARTATERPEPRGYCIRKSGRNAGKKYNYYWRQGKSAKKRSETFSGIARAMAEQWGEYVKATNTF